MEYRIYCNWICAIPKTTKTFRGGIIKMKAIEVKNISKSFPGVKALDNVDLTVYEGEVMALLGENGAGKSTLMKILSGVYRRDAGEIFLEGNKIEMMSPKEATDQGIAIIHQELNLIQDMKVYENIFLGREITSSIGGLNKKEMIVFNEALYRLIVTPL